MPPGAEIVDTYIPYMNQWVLGVFFWNAKKSLDNRNEMYRKSLSCSSGPIRSLIYSEIASQLIKI